MKKPVVDLSDCILCGVCVEVCPSVFKFNEADYIEVAECEHYAEIEIDDAIKNCPTDCIGWEYD